MAGSWRAAFAALALAIFAAAHTTAESAQQQAPVFRSGTSLVALNVTVTDHKHQYMKGLRAEDFEVYEDGVRQRVQFFGASEVPLDLILLIDTSSSMSPILPVVHRAAHGFIETMRDVDRAAVVAFADGVRVLQALTSDRARVESAIDQTSAKGATALHNAVYVALKSFGTTAAAAAGRDVRRQAIAVLSDGQDTSSGLSFDDVLDMARHSGVSIYTIGLKNDRIANGSERPYFSESDFTMKQLAIETGALPFFPRSVNELGSVYTTIATELGSQYSIGYVPQNTQEDGKYRRVAVRVANRPELKPRTRAGYFLSSSTGAQ